MSLLGPPRKQASLQAPMAKPKRSGQKGAAPSPGPGCHHGVDTVSGLFSTSKQNSNGRIHAVVVRVRTEGAMEMESGFLDGSI